MTKPREKTREELQAEIEDGKKKIRQFENREKMLRQKLSKEERRTRSHRLIVRGAVFESIVPEAKNMTDEEAAALLRLALKGYLHNELEADADDEAAGNNRTHIAFRKVWKTVAVAAITLTLLFSTCMVANAQFRERVISWVIETFEKYSIFELHGDELDEPQDLTEYQAGYLPDGAILKNTTELPGEPSGLFSMNMPSTKPRALKL